jgi:hypothetical protein
MATVHICDVKECGVVIESKDLKNIKLLNRDYQLCKKCNDGLIKFLDDNLLKPEEQKMPMQRIDLQDLFKQTDSISYPNIQTGPIWQVMPDGSGLTYGAVTLTTDSKTNIGQAISIPTVLSNK